MQLSKKVLVAVFLAAFAGAFTAYALTTFVIPIVIEISKPPAEAKIEPVTLSAAPYQYVEKRWVYAGYIVQHSYVVNYTVTLEAKNMKKLKVCIRIANQQYFVTERNIVAEKCLVLDPRFPTASRTSFVLKGQRTWWIYLDIYGMTTDKKAEIKLYITPQALP